MGSYVISVSAGTGCYRHIQISQTATLYKLHKAILNAFDFADDHEHAFFMDNKYWSGYAAFFSSKIRGDERLTKSCKLEQLDLSKGDQFKYIFDFGAEWRFQCKVLRELNEQTDIPGVIRRMGESQEQYPEFEEDWEDTVNETTPVPLIREQIDDLYASIPLDKSVIVLIHRYMDAAANLYGLVSLAKLLEIYNSHNTPVDANVFGMVAIAVAVEDNPYELIFRDDVPQDTVEKSLEAGEILADYLFVEEPEWSIRNLRHQQSGKSYKILPKVEFLRYADPDYFPATAQQVAMLKYLRRRTASLSLPPEDFCNALQSIIVIDAPLKEVLAIAKSEGLTFDGHWDLGEFATLYHELNNNTHKHVNCGHTPNELFLMTDLGRKLSERLAPAGQMSLFEEPVSKPNLTIIGTTPRNAPCPCGSGRKYKNCCGKGK